MAMILDVRNEEDFQTRHNFRSIRIPFDQIDQEHIHGLEELHPEEILIMADNQMQGDRSVEKLKSLSLDWNPKIKVYNGGMDAWMADGKPTNNYMTIGHIRLNPPVVFLIFTFVMVLLLAIFTMTYFNLVSPNDFIKVQF